MSRSNLDKAFCPHNGFFQVSSADPNRNPAAAARTTKVNTRNEDALENRET